MQKCSNTEPVLCMIDVLPRWAYHDEEWFDLKLSADKVIDGIMYQYKKIEKPKKKKPIASELVFG